MEFPTQTYRYDSVHYPSSLRRVSGPPKKLYWRGAELTTLLARPKVAIVGTRAITPYGKKVTTDLAGQLAEQGVIIISGLAYGVDSCAHQAALEAGGLTLAVLPSPVDAIAPPGNRWLANKILSQGGALVSEYPSGAKVYKQYFVARNRIVAGLADALLITEASEKSGTQHTAAFARGISKDVMVVPGNITNRGAAGVNNLLKSGAHPITDLRDILNVLQLRPHTTKLRHVKGRNANEQRILNSLLQGTSRGEELLEKSGLDVSQFNQTLTMLEITAKVRPLGNNHWALY